MNTDKILDEKFINRKDYPVWYYKELYEIDVDDVIWSLLKRPYVVEINGSKHEITFGKNRKGEIGQCIRYDDIKNSNLCSFEVVRRGFKEGKWFVITDKDTSEEFKSNYRERKTQYEREETKEWYKKILGNVIKDDKDLTEEQRSDFILWTEDASFEELEKLIKSLFEKFKE